MGTNMATGAGTYDYSQNAPFRDIEGTYLNKAFAKNTGNRLLVVGDSITYLDGGNLSDNPLDPVETAYSDGSKATGMFAWANAMLGHRIKMAGNGGVPGENSEQILARIDSLLRIPCDFVSALSGANDFAQGWEASRTIAAQKAIYDKIVAAGKRPIVLTTMSRSSMNNAAGYLYLATVNQALKNYARNTPGAILADISSVMTNPATGVPYTAPNTTGDGTHPNAIGAHAMGKVIADALRPIIPATDVFSSNNLDPLNYCTNACNTGTTGTVANGITGTPGTGWQFTAPSGVVEAAVSKVARTDGLPGEWTRCTIGPTNTANIIAGGTVRFDATGANGVKVGDKITVAIEVRVSGLTGVSRFDGGYFHTSTLAYDLNGIWQQGSGPVTDGTYVLMVEGTVIGAGATYIQTRVQVTATGGIFDIGRSTVFKTL
ncbi:esterase [Arthrobacter phage Casserole]|nr:esterase [Arthrobacter phage Casserole]